jgi:hypothetical protein
MTSKAGSISKSNIEITDPRWKSLFKVGGVGTMILVGLIWVISGIAFVGSA